MGQDVRTEFTIRLLSMSGSSQPETSTSSPYRILFVTHTAEWIGPNISLLELLVRLPESLRPLVAVNGTGRFTDVLEEHGIPFLSLKRLDKYAIPSVARAIRRAQVSLVYGNSAHGASRNALVAAKFCGVPFVYHLREMAKGRRRKKALFPWADAAIAVSRATADSYDGSFREPPRVVYNGVSLERFDLDRETCRREVRSEFGIDQDASIVIHVGNVYRRKGQRLALDVFREVQRTTPDSHLLIVGRLDRDPGYVDGLRSAVAEYGLEDRVTIAGLRIDVARLLAAADVFLHTALEDPHPRAVIEAMAARLPVVAVAVDGVSETVVDGETGFLVRPPRVERRLAERVVALLNSPALLETMGDRGRDRIGRLFSAERTARDVAEVILEQVGRQ